MGKIMQNNQNLRNKKRKEKLFYGLFLSISTASITPTIMIVTIMPMIPGRRYMVATDSVCANVGACVGAAGSTANEVTACDGQYDSLPANDAYTVYCPSL